MHFSFKQPEVPFHLILASMIWLFSFGGLQAQEKANLTSTAEFGGKWGTKVEEAIKALELKGNVEDGQIIYEEICEACLLYTSPSPRDATLSRMPSSA